MKKVLCLALVLLMLAVCAAAENAKLPQPDEDGITTYTGEVGLLLDENGEYIKESLFDESVRKILEIVGVAQATVEVQPAAQENEHPQITISIIGKGVPSVPDAQYMGETAIRTIGDLFGMLEEYEASTAETFGTLFDAYQVMVTVLSTAGSLISFGAVSAGSHVLMWQ